MMADEPTSDPTLDLLGQTPALSRSAIPNAPDTAEEALSEIRRPRIAVGPIKPAKPRKDRRPDRNKPKKDKGRRCPPGFHWNKKQKQCVPNDPRQPDPGNRPLMPEVGVGGGGGGGGGGGAGGGPPGFDFDFGGGGGSGDGSSGGGAAPADPDQPLISAAIRLYFSLWGQVPPTNYIEKLVKQGMNLFEIELHERSKPAFQKTKVYRDEASQFVSTRDQLLGIF